MYGLFGFDPASMSDEELMERQQALQARLVWAGRFGNPEMVSGLQSLLQSIDFERQERYLRFVHNERMKMLPSVIESEPDLRVANEELDKPERKIAPQQKPRLAITRTSRPVEEKIVHEDPNIESTDKDKDTR